MQEQQDSQNEPPVTDEEITETVSEGFARIGEGVNDLVDWAQANQTDALAALAVAAGLYVAMLLVRMLMHAALK